MFNKYYQDELSFLREMGREFSRANPEAAPFLAERGTDPDVERLLEGFAFLTGRIRQKLDDELPEFTHALMQMLWPHYLRPIPSMAILQFDPPPGQLKETGRIPRGTQINSAPVDGTPCRFQTVYDVAVHPMSQEGVELKMEAPPHIRLKFRLSEGVSLKKSPIPEIRLYLQGDPVVARALYLCLLHNLKRVVIRPSEGGLAGKTLVLGPESVRAAGFQQEEALLPTPPTSFEGFRLLLEYFAFPTKFLFVDLAGLERLAELGEFKAFEVTFELARLPEAMPPLGTAGILTNCTPIVNLFKHDADPIRLDLQRTEYKIRPSGSDGSHYEIYSVNRVLGVIKGAPKPKEYLPFLGFSHSLSSSGEDASYYKTRTVDAVGAEGTDNYITFVGGEPAGVVPETETITMELTCTNRQLPQRLKLGEINVATGSSPVWAKFRNITKATASVPPPLGGDVYWRLLSHLSLNYLSLNRVEALRSIVGLYNFRAMVDRQAEQANKVLQAGIKRVTSRPAVRLFRGDPVRGVAVELELEEDQFAGEGDMFLFSTMLNEFFSLYVTLNSFSQLTVKGLKYGEVYTWPPRIGGRITL